MDPLESICRTLVEVMAEYPQNQFEELILQEGIIRHGGST